MSERPRPLVSVLLIISRLLGLAVLIAGLAFIGWLIFSAIQRDPAVGLAVWGIVLTLMGTSVYIGIRLGLKHRRRSEQALEEYRERIRAKREREGHVPDGEGPDSKAKP